MNEGCAKKNDQNAAQTGEGTALSEEQELALEILSGKVDEDSWTFPRSEVRREANQPLFAHLVTTSKKPELIAASLSALRAGQRGPRVVDSTVLTAVKTHLKSDDPRVLGRALRLAAPVISSDESNAEVVAQLTELGKQLPGGAERYAIITALDGVPLSHRTPAVTEILLQALEAKEAYVVSVALQAIKRGYRSFQDKDGLRKKVVPLLGHADAGVRGRAIALLVLLDQSAPDLPAKTIAALQDESPYVRAEACWALAKIRPKEAMHALIPLLEDRSEAVYTINAIPTLDGDQTRLNHRMRTATVREAAMQAVDDLAGKALTLPHVPKANRDAALTRNAEMAREWYTANQAQFPGSKATTGEAPKDKAAAAKGP
jgi:hypothetical protein